MHCLEVIILRNAQAAGRELGHAVNDVDDELVRRVNLANLCYHVLSPEYRVHFHGYNCGREEK